VFVQRNVLRRSRKVQPQSAPPDCGFSTSATPKEFGAISPAGTGLVLQNCNDQPRQIFNYFSAGPRFPGPPLFQRTNSWRIAKMRDPDLASSDCLAFAEAVLCTKELKRS